MEIDIYSVIISIFALGCFFVPIYYYEYSRKKATKIFTSYFKQIAQKNNIELSQYDVWRDQYGIGIDTDAKKIMYLKKVNGHDNTVLLDLSEFKRCRLSKKDNRINTPEGDRKITTRIDLRIEPLSPNKTDNSVEFYKGEKGDFVSDEVKLAEKWTKIINSKLTNS